ncbi:MAG TPA: SMP-30/gluconolactonase/LRE family protein [Casimicrobiaceae bacterium]|nr:SMP-30/gluconolactonase/LRE family protein [Casimicrobiaceae bacterium]
MPASSESPFTCVLDARASLGECPTWSVSEQVLYWVDINAPALHRFDPATGRDLAMPMPASIGCFALRERGGFVIALRDGIWLADRAGKLERRIVEAPYDPAHHRFNDGRCGPDGRFFAGSMNEKRDASTGALYRLDADGVLTIVVPGVTISNGLAWSPDGRTMYHADTTPRTIHAYDYDAATGVPSGKRVFAQWDGDTDRPDGSAVDSAGNYWTAFYRGGKIVKLSPRGETLAEYPIPAKCPTMCAFGGADLRTLYVTSARQMREAAELARLPNSGGVFSMRVDTPGLPEPHSPL